MPAPRLTRTRLALSLLAIYGSAATAAENSAELPEVTVVGQAAADGSAAQGYRVERVKLGPLGDADLQDTPLTINAVPAELIRNSGATNTTEALKYVPTIYSATGASQLTPYFSMRGFSASTWTYNMALDGLRSFDIYQPLEDKERIEVLSGASGFLYGITSPAGMINYVSKRPSSKPLAELTVGTYDQQVYSQLDLGGRLAANPDLAYRLNLAYGDKGRTAVDGQSQERHLVSSAIDWRLVPNTRLSVDAAHSQRDLKYAQALFMTTAAIGIPKAPDASKNWGAPYTGASDATSRIGAALEHRFNEIFTLRAQVRYSDIEREYFLNRQVWQNKNLDYKWRVDSQQNIHTTVDQYQVFVDANFRSGPLQHQLSLGATLDHFDSADNGYRGTTYAGVYPGNLNATPGYRAWSLPPAGTSTAQETTYRTLLFADRLSLGEHWSLLLGLNRASVDDRLTSTTAAGVSSTTAYEKSKTTPAVALSFKPLPLLSTYVSYVEALQQGIVAGTTTSNAGEVFAPFVSKQREVGAKATLGGLGLQLAWFDIDQANQYVDPATNRASQDGRETHRGWEFSLTGKLSERLRLTGGFTVLDARIDKATANVGKTPQGVPEHMARLYAEYDLPFVAGLTLNGGASYSGRIPWDAANTLYVDAVTVYDAGLRYQIQLAGKDTTWRLNVANLTDKDYWTTRSGILYLGAPRTLSASASLAF
jgi:iron complex outermembrane receptor protein